MSRSSTFRAVAFLLLSTLLMPAATAQIEPVSGLPITGSGQVNVGYTNSNSNGSGANSVFVGTAGVFDGYYHNPRFLKFSVAPNFRWDRNSGDRTSTIADQNTGLMSRAEFLPGSSMPLTFQYSYFHTGTATVLNGVQPLELAANGSTQNFMIGWSFRRKHVPTIGIAYNWGSSHSSVSGSDAPEMKSNNKGFNVNATQSLLGFNLSGNYNWMSSEQHSSDILNIGVPLEGKNTQSTEGISVTRSLPLRSLMDAQFTHTASDYSAFGLPQKLAFDIASAHFSTSPIKRLNLLFGTVYTSNASARALSRIVSGEPVTPSSDAPQLLPVGRSLTSTAQGNYDVGHGFYVQSIAHHENSELVGQYSVGSTDINAGVYYSRLVKKGLLNLSYAPGFSRATFAVGPFEATSGTMTHSGSASYGRRLGRFTNQARFSFTQNSASQAYYLPIISRSMAVNFRTATRVWHQWSVTVFVSLDKADIPGRNGIFNKNFAGTVANRTWTFNVQQQWNSGYSVLSSAGLVQLTPGEAAAQLVPHTLYTNTSGLTASVTYVRRRLSVTGVYNNSDVGVNALPTAVRNGSGNLETRVVYKLRKVDIRAGFRWWTQNSSGNSRINSNQRVFWFDIVRPFRLF